MILLSIPLAIIAIGIPIFLLYVGLRISIVVLRFLWMCHRRKAYPRIGIVQVYPNNLFTDHHH